MNLEKSTQVNKSSQTNAFPPRGILQRKCACGRHTPVGGECTACSKKKLNQSLQTRLNIGDANDKYEQEADRVAGQVMRMPKTKNNGAGKYRQAIPFVQRRVFNRQSGATEAPSIVHDVLSTSGQPLDQATRNYMEPRFNHDFSQVRIHSDRKAGESASAVSAKAYTVGQDIVFGTGQYVPGTSIGNHLLAHELTHVIQQGGADSTRAPYEDSDMVDSTRESRENLDTEDTTLQKHETIDTEKTIEGISRQTAPKLISGPMLQRAPCPCCTDSISISNINRIDNAARMGHSFDTNMGLSYPVSGPQGSCTLEWWEKTNIPYVAGMAANTWTDMYQLLGGASFGTWNNRQESCGTSTLITDNDPPSLAKRAGRTATRTLEFRIVINSMPAVSTAGCANASQQITATQVLSMVNGAPNWAASSFTTP